MTKKIADYSQHLDATRQLLLRLQSIAAQNDVAPIMEIVRAVDWNVVTDEFDGVPGRYHNEVYRHARRIIKNLLRPYLVYHDCSELSFHKGMLLSTIAASPSLRATAGKAIERAYVQVRWKYGLRGHKLRTLPTKSPWTTPGALLKAIKVKQKQGRDLEDSFNVDYGNCRRCPVPDL